MRRALGLPAVVVLLVLGAGAGAARADVVWLCKPGQADNPCRESLETTVYADDGSSRVDNPPLAADPKIDCFYVYPTVSGQPGTNADKSKDDELYEIARYQAARFSQLCRVFAPVYRQLTLASIAQNDEAARREGGKIAYGDVREAWLEYLQRDNGGRPFVLIGHSQGTRMLRQLIREEVDPKPELRSRLLSAILLGGNVLVRKGEKVGGDFNAVPACESADQTGCVIAYSTFNDPPPDDSRFGRSPATDTTGAGFPFGPGYEVLCTNPASLDANSRTPLTTILRSEPFPGLLGVLLVQMYGGPPPSAPTPWLIPNERYSARCEQSAGANVLMLESIGSARKLNPAPDDTWGLHLADVNIALGDLVAVVGRQASAFLAHRPKATPRLALHLRCVRSGIRVAVGGADRGALRRVDVRVRGALVARDRRSPFAAVVPRARARGRAATTVRVLALLADGRRARLARTIRGCG